MSEPIPHQLFDGPAVFEALSVAAKRRTSAENVSDVLDAVVKLIRGYRPIPGEVSSQWKPISEAPKDTEILGWWNNEEIHVGGIYQGEWRRQMDTEAWAMPDKWTYLPSAPK